MAVVDEPVTDDRSKARLLWRCRRGMLELDLLLQPFVEAYYDTLTSQEQAQFHELLDLQDQQLLEYLLGQEMSDSPDLRHIIKKIRDAV